MAHFWTAALSFGGVGAIGAFVFWSLYRGWLRLGIFQALSSAQTFRLMILFLVLTFIFASIALVGYLLKDRTPVHATDTAAHPIYPPLSTESLKNATYTVMDDTLTFKNGKRHFGNSPSEEGYVSADIDEIAFGDLDGDGNIDAAVVVGVNYGGSGTFTLVIPALNRGGAPLATNPNFEIGDRNVFRSVSITDQIVSVEYLTQGPNDALCCPSVLQKINLRLDGKELKCADKACHDATDLP